METRTPAMERETFAAPGSRPHHRDGCLSPGLGCSSGRSEYRGSLVRRGTPEPYQPPGVVGCSSGSADLHNGRDSVPCTPADGQPDGGVLHQPHGGDQVPTALTHGLPTVGVVPEKGGDTLSRVPPGVTQCDSRQGISDTPIICRMAIEQVSVPGSDEPLWPVECGSLHNEAELSTPSLHQLAARPIRSSNGCFQDPMDGHPGICLSSICPDRQVPTEDTPGGFDSGADSSSLALPIMVPMAPGDAGLPSSPSAGLQEFAARPFQQGPPSACQGTATASHLESVRRTCSLSGISERTSDIITAGWRRRTNSAYQSGWVKWNSWCDARRLNSLSCSVQHFLEFLTELFDSGLQHRTINVVRSAVSMTHERVEGVPIGQHPLVTRLMKGVYNLRLPKPRYTYTWDVDMVTQYIVGMGENTSLPLRQLSQKLALLMALVVASRTSELQALDLRFRVYRPNGVLFRLTGITKTQRVGSPPKERFFGAFSDKQLCVVDCLKCYEEATAKHRDPQSEVQPLFLSYIRPFKPVTSQRIAHWIKDILSEAGVDTRVFNLKHTVRGASVSAAKGKGVGIPDIFEMADWSRDTTFRKFYYRTTTSNHYTQNLLQPADGK